MAGHIPRNIPLFDCPRTGKNRIKWANGTCHISPSITDCQLMCSAEFG
jgi:hypothetical protein